MYELEMHNILLFIIGVALGTHQHIIFIVRHLGVFIEEPSDGLNVRVSFVSMVATVSRWLRDAVELDFLDGCLLYDKSSYVLRNYIKKNWKRLLRNKECCIMLKDKYRLLCFNRIA